MEGGRAGEMELSPFLFHREWFETKGECWGRDNWVSEGTGKLYRD